MKEEGVEEEKWRDEKGEEVLRREEEGNGRNKGKGNRKGN